MIEEVIETVQSPSKAAIAKATAIALLVAAVLLITAVLPAEYGIDPLGTGQALHLTDLASRHCKGRRKPDAACPHEAWRGAAHNRPGFGACT